MIRIGLIFFTALWCTTSSVPQSRLKHGPDGVSMERLNSLLRKTGTILRGPLILPDIPHGASHVDDGLQPPVEESYNFYLPSFGYDYNEKPQSSKQILTEITPPKPGHEPNYYSRKQRKYPKKYSSSLKQVNIKPVVENNYEPNYEPSINTKAVKKEPKIVFDDEYFEGSIHASTPKPEHYRHISSKPYLRGFKAEQDQSDVEKNLAFVPHSAKNNDDNSRIEYQVHGFDGPKSYKFGYDTGKGKDRHFRFEERDNQGEVKGEYGYRDNEGKVTIVRYTSTADKGFQVEKTS